MSKDDVSTWGCGFGRPQHAQLIQGLEKVQHISAVAVEGRRRRPVQRRKHCLMRQLTGGAGAAGGWAKALNTNR